MAPWRHLRRCRQRPGQGSGNTLPLVLEAEALVERCLLPVHACFFGGPDLIGGR
jgi:hypothetical protein